MTDLQPVFNKPMSTKEIEEFREILAKSYKVNDKYIIWTKELDEHGKKTGNVIYYMKLINKLTGEIEKEEGGDRIREIFKLNIR